MTDLRVSQVAIDVLASSDPDPRISQLVAVVLGIEGTEPLVSQLALVALVQIAVQPHISQLAMVVLGTEVDCVSYLVSCWRIARRDGVIHAFTSHDMPITYKGDTYEPCGSIDPSAYQASGQFGEVGNASLMGLLSVDGIQPGIPSADIEAGLLDAAEVQIWEIPWQGTETAIPILKGYVGKISQKDINYEAEVITMSGLLNNQALLDTYTPNCRFELGDSRCTVDLSLYTETSTVDGLAAGSTRLQSKKRQFFDSARIEVDNYWQNGILTWTSGNNTGYSSEVASSTDVGSIILWNVMPNNIELTDGYTIIAGCDKRKDTCINKFSNFLNFGGFPDIPGNDIILQTPDARQ